MAGRLSKPAGTVSLLSFIKDGVLYQMLRTSPGYQSSTKDGTAELLLTVEPPMRLQSFRQLNYVHSRESEVGLRGCKIHKACLTASLPVGDVPKPTGRMPNMHWQAQLFKLDLGSCGTEVIMIELNKEREEERKDHQFITVDDLEPLPRFQAHLTALDVNKPHVFLASFRLFEYHGETIAGVAEPTLSHGAVSHFIRNGVPQAPGTATMWESIFNARQDRRQEITELCEGSIVGRCLEKILCVDLVPATIPQYKGHENAPSHFTLVSNMFLKASVDLTALFWKIRFLVKVDGLLSRTIKGHAPGFQVPCDYDKSMSESRSENSHYMGSNEDIITAEATVRRIRFVIGEVMAYVAMALLKHASVPPILLPENNPGNPSHYYIMITICYVVRCYPMARWAWQYELSEEEGAWGRGILAQRLPDRQANPLLRSNHMATKVKYSLLEWLHHESILSLRTDSLSGRVIPAEWQVEGRRLQDARYAVKAELVRRISLARAYRADDEIADRLGFLAGEMWGPGHITARAVAERIIKRVNEREYSRQLNLCQSSRLGESTDDGPWELHALCHHSRLVVAHRNLCTAATIEGRQEVEVEVEHYRNKFYPFLTSEASLNPCWERNGSSARQGFLRSEATAVLASTILDIFIDDFEFDQHSARRQLVSPTDRPPSIVVDEDLLHSHNPSRQANAPSIRRLQESLGELNTQTILVRQLEAIEDLANIKPLERDIDYLEFRPPSRYHPVEFFNSLDDTPELYDNVALAKREASMPAVISKRLSEQVPPRARPYSWRAELPFDGLERPLEHANRLRELLVGRVRGSPPATYPNSDLWGIDVRVAAEQLRKLTIVDLITPDPLPLRKPRPIRGAQIVRVVSDSLIDQEVRHRFLLASVPYELPPGLLRLLVYVLHPEMAECFKNHLLRVSRFELWSRQETVVVHITLRSWSLVFPEKGFSATKEDDRIYLPSNLHREDRDPLNSMELKVSSIGMSTNFLGDFSKCCIITDLIREEEINALGERAQEIWDGFTHQPQTGRFLVFSLVLGLICQAMVSHYADMITDFLVRTGLEEQIPSYLEDPSNLQRRDADVEVRFGLWSLEVLNKLAATMDESIGTIDEAIKSMKEAIRYGPGKRSMELETACQKHIESLERSFSNLTDIRTSLDRKIQLNARCSNALSAVLAVRGSRDSYKQTYQQNITIEKLTYLTIGCLPVGLAAVSIYAPCLILG